jgi:hypothetical protein
MAAPTIPLTLRNVKGSELTVTEGDNNFTSLRSAIQQITVFTPAMFSILGNGTDETVKIQNMFNAAAGGIIICPTGLNFGFSSQLTIPASTTIITNGSIFTRSIASLTHGVVIEENVSIDVLVVLTPGGASGEKSVLISGFNVSIGRLSLVATSEGSFTSTNYGLEIEAAGQLGNIRIESCRIKNFRSAIFAKNIKGFYIESLEIENYRIGVYLRDITDSEFGPARIFGKSATLTGSAGENGLLVETSLSSNSTRNLAFNNWIVEDSGEHGFRLGGQLTMSNIVFNSCQSIRPGVAYTVGYASATAWFGGCGFKALGATTVTGQRHKNIYFNNCSVIDGSINVGAFPAGHGINNFTAFNVYCCDDVHINSCDVINSGLPAASAVQAIILGACNNVNINNFSCDATSRPALVINDEAPGANDGWEFGVNGLYINGGNLKVIPSNTNCIYIPAVRYAHTDWKIKNLSVYGGRFAMRAETPGTGTLPTDCVASITYQDSDSDEATITSPIVNGAQFVRATVDGPWRVAAASPELKNGSIFIDSITGTIRRKASGSWAVV